MTRLRESWALNFPFDQVSLHSLSRSKLNLDPLQGLKQAVICDDTTADGGPGKLRKVTSGSGSTTCNEEEIEQVLCSVSGFSFIDGMILGFQAWLQFVLAFCYITPLTCQYQEDWFRHLCHTFEALRCPICCHYLVVLIPPYQHGCDATEFLNGEF